MGEERRGEVCVQYDPGLREGDLKEGKPRP